MFPSLPRSRLLKQEAVPIIVSKTPKQIPKVGLPSSATDGNNMQPDGTKHLNPVAAVYLNAVFEYLAAELLEVAMRAAAERTREKNASFRITLVVLNGIEKDPELKYLTETVLQRDQLMTAG
ncbi:hypothetical protein AVEN_185625-1 [Araneus ventricosus]|uniref:Histone H2A n=1 Tax=Araneus ventricosus TaxID=182803 RepID=A0A4Y2JY18_ARAVE|nr:hypothetical protein AVEN_185625-1 [Araneus ventricosus]